MCLSEQWEKIGIIKKRVRNEGREYSQYLTYTYMTMSSCSMVMNNEHTMKSKYR